MRMYYNGGEFKLLLDAIASEVKKIVYERALLYSEFYNFYRIKETGDIKGPIDVNEIYARMKLEIISKFSKECSDWHTAMYFQEGDIK